MSQKAFFVCRPSSCFDHKSSNASTGEFNEPRRNFFFFVLHLQLIATKIYFTEYTHPPQKCGNFLWLLSFITLTSTVKYKMSIKFAMDYVLCKTYYRIELQ
jgi:hypothetical protein